MRKELLSITLTAVVLAANGISFAANNYDMATPAVQYAPVENYEYQTQYPLPVNSFQNQGYTNANYNNQLHGNVVMVPANTAFSAAVVTPISSETAKTGDSVSMYLNSDFYYGKHLIAAAGSRLNGTVILAKKGGFGQRNGKLQIKFTNIITPAGQMIPLSAHIQTEDGSGILKAGTAKDTTVEYVKDAGVGAAAGAVLGTAMGALSSGSVGKGAIYGTALGGGMGLIKTITERGGNVELPPNALLNIVIDQPVTVSSNTPY